MSLKAAAAKILAHSISKKVKKEASAPQFYQDQQLQLLLEKGRQTAFGKDHKLAEVRSYEEFRQAVPIVDYEGLRPYADRVVVGESDVLWPGRPIYFAKTSGTTSGTKYIPITKDSISNHIDSARNMLLCYIAQKGSARFVDGKLIFLQGSPVLEDSNGVQLGRLSGIVAHHVPKYLQKNRLPSWETNCIEDWEDKVDAIVKETLGNDMRLISGIPPWVQMYFDRIREKTGKAVGQVFPNFNLLVHGGVNFTPYKAKLIETIGREVDILETYPASEGFIAYQDNYQQQGLLINVNSGIFFEFIPTEQFHDENPTRLMLSEVQIGVNYVLIINSNAGLWGYNIGDTVKFISIEPYKILVTGRIKHFISAFGEHVIGQEVSDALAEVCRKQNIRALEFTVAPCLNPEEGLPHHEWFIEFDKVPGDLSFFSIELDEAMRRKNSYYDDLISGSILRALVIRPVRQGGFKAYMKSIGKLGGQNKVPQLGNDRKVADVLMGQVIK